MKQRSESKVGRQKRGTVKERKVRENLQAVLLFMIEGHLSLSPFCVELVKTLLFQLSLANVAFRAASRMPLGDFRRAARVSRTSKHVFRSLRMHLTEIDLIFVDPVVN